MENFDELSPERIRQINTRWKSDVDLKLDRLCHFADSYEDYLKLCLKREVDRDRLRMAIIEKTWGALILAGLGMVGAAIWQYIREHIK